MVAMRTTRSHPEAFNPEPSLIQPTSPGGCWGQKGCKDSKWTYGNVLTYAWIASIGHWGCFSLLLGPWLTQQHRKMDNSHGQRLQLLGLMGNGLKWLETNPGSRHNQSGDSPNPLWIHLCHTSKSASRRRDAKRVCKQHYSSHKATWPRLWDNFCLTHSQKA